MNKRHARGVLSASIAATALFLDTFEAANAHHSFAMYDQTQVMEMTGRLTRFIPAPNHAQILFELLEADGTPVLDGDGKPVAWGVETGPSTRIARQGVTPDNFPVGTIIAVSLNPLRDGRTFGAMSNGTPLIHCGMDMPVGGCSAETGTAYLTENN